jgi:MFS transporter, DHA1 family, inner membrane transport protein
VNPLDPQSGVRRARTFDAPERITYVNALFIIGTLGTLITPALLEVWGPRLHWTQSQLGLAAAAELVTLALGSLSGLYWQRRWDWRFVATGALLLAVLGNLACMRLDDFVGVCIARAASGLGGGLLCAIYSAFLANTHSPGRNIAITTFVQIGVEAAFLYSSTSVAWVLGATGLFTLMAGLSGALIPLIRLLPAGWPSDSSAPAEAAVPDQRPRRAYPILLSFVPFILFQAGVYTFLGDFGRLAAGLDVAQTLHAIGLSVVFSALGSVAAYVLDDRAGLLLPICGVILLLIGMMFAMICGSTSASLFLLYISLLQAGWIFLNCYLYSALIDANKLLVAAATPVSSFGSAFGASAMGYVLEHGGLQGALSLSVAALGLTALLTIPFLRRGGAPAADAAGAAG